MKNDHLLIDADILLYKAISSTEQEIEWEPDVWTITTDLRDASSMFTDLINQIREDTQLLDFTLCFSDSANFRKEVYPAYKSNRANTRKPVGFKAFKEMIMNVYHDKIICKPTLEADDCIGILATKFPNRYTIVSGDKDLMQISGQHWVDGRMIEVTESDGDLLFYTQTLTGDAVDGYPGCPGVGKVKAEKILNWPCAEKKPWEFIVEAYEKAGLTEEDALVQARCARILRYSDWDEKNKKVILWKPNN